METLHSNKLSGSNSASATQMFLDVAEVKEDVVILKNGSFRAILAVSAINFDLKSTEEQDAIITQYQNFLNSLDFPAQILISSRKLNINHYLEFIDKRSRQQTNELLKLQISEYKNFITQLVSVSNIMDKNFYIIVPFSAVENENKSFLSNVMDNLNPQRSIQKKRENFETYKNQLFQRLDHISTSLSGIGLRLTPLKTQEIIELLYNSYNPNLFTNQEIGDVSNLEIQ
jgi:type IV secretory pathway VirB4 component